VPAFVQLFGARGKNFRQMSSSLCQYGDVILPFTILRRLDCILEADQG
jgi:type I restriction-modification system DNA methylase subunit